MVVSAELISPPEGCCAAQDYPNKARLAKFMRLRDLLLASSFSEWAQSDGLQAYAASCALTLSSAVINLCRQFISESLLRSRSLRTKPGLALGEQLSFYGDLFSLSLLHPPGSYLARINSEDEEELLSAALTDNDLISVYDIGFLYEQLFSEEAAKRDGIFFTPPIVARRIVKEALAPAIKVWQGPGPAVLDPACGSGMFLIEAYKLLLDELNCGEINNFSHSQFLLSNCLFGVDKDARALELTRLSLLLTAIGTPRSASWVKKFCRITIPLVCGNSLFDESDFNSLDNEPQTLKEQLQVFSWSRSFADVFRRGGFDFIVGNPPYGLSRNEQISLKENEKLKSVYQQYRNGKVNKYLAFMARGYQLLAPEGRMSFIVPNAWLGIKGGAALRKIILTDKSLASVELYHCTVFENISLEAVTFVIDRGKQHEYIHLIHTHNLAEQKPTDVMRVAVSSCLRNPANVIPSIWSDHAEEILDHIDSTTYRLGDPESPFVALIALQAYAQGKGNPPQSLEDVKKHIFHRAEQEDENTFRYLEGGDISRFGVKWRGSYLKYGPWLAEFQPLDRYSCPRILVREILSPIPHLLSAAFAKDIYLYNRSILHILPKTGTSEEMVLALQAILNSKVSSFIIRYRGRKSQRRLFPKIVNDDLSDFRIPRSFTEHVPILAAIAKEFTRIKEDQNTAQGAVRRRQATTFPHDLEERLSSAVFNAYKLDVQHRSAFAIALNMKR